MISQKTALLSGPLRAGSYEGRYMGSLSATTARKAKNRAVRFLPRAGRSESYKVCYRGDCLQDNDSTRVYARRMDFSKAASPAQGGLMSTTSPRDSRAPVM